MIYSVQQLSTPHTERRRTWNSITFLFFPVNYSYSVTAMIKDMFRLCIRSVWWFWLIMVTAITRTYLYLLHFLHNPALFVTTVWSRNIYSVSLWSDYGKKMIHRRHIWSFMCKATVVRFSPMGHSTLWGSSFLRGNLHWQVVVEYLQKAQMNLNWE